MKVAEEKLQLTFAAKKKTKKKKKRKKKQVKAAFTGAALYLSVT